MRAFISWDYKGPHLALSGLVYICQCEHIEMMQICVWKDTKYSHLINDWRKKNNLSRGSTCNLEKSQNKYWSNAYAASGASCVTNCPHTNFSSSSYDSTGHTSLYDYSL